MDNVAIKLTFKYSDRHIHIMLCGDVIATLLLMVAKCGDVATIYPPLNSFTDNAGKVLNKYIFSE